MGKRDDLIELYAQDLKTKCNMKPDMDLLKKVVIGLGPSVYNKDSSTVAASDKAELETVKKNFMIKKLGLTERHDLDGALAKVIDTYGRSNRTKHRAVLYYMLVKHFKKSSVYA